MKALLPILLGILVPTTMAAPMPEKGDILAVNTVIASYSGISERPCYFRTADCPDRCDHALKLANFRVLKNESYQKPGKYGDDKADTGSSLHIDIKHDVPGQDESVAKEIEKLAPGDTVRMTITHFYVDDNGSRYPIRPVTMFEKIEKPADAPTLPPPRKYLLTSCLCACCRILTATSLFLSCPVALATGQAPFPAHPPAPQWSQTLFSPQGEKRLIIFIGGLGDEISGIIHHLSLLLPSISPDMAEHRAYYHWGLGHADSLQEALHDLAIQIETYRTTHSDTELVLIGHSLGAASALKLSELLMPGVGKIALITLDPVDRSTTPHRPKSVTWWGNSYVQDSQSPRDFIAVLGGRWDQCAGADLNLRFDGHYQDESGHPYIHDNATALILSRGNEKRTSLFDALRAYLTNE